MSDKLDALGKIIEDLFKVIDDELVAQNWRLNFKPEKQKILDRLVKLAKE